MRNFMRQSFMWCFMQYHEVACMVLHVGQYAVPCNVMVLHGASCSIHVVIYVVLHAVSRIYLHEHHKLSWSDPIMSQPETCVI